MTRGVVITGMGVISPIGDSPAALRDALTADDAVTPASDGDGRELRVESFAAEAYLRDHSLSPLDRPARLLASAARLALDDAGWTGDRLHDEDVGLVVGTMFSTVRTIAEFDRRAQREGPGYASPLAFANTVINAPAGQAAIWHNLRGLNVTVAAGAASGLLAVAHAADLVRTGQARVILAGGVEELSFESASGFRQAGALCGAGGPRPFDARRDGFALGEGAALVVLEGEESAAARGARVLARVSGHGSRFDPARGRRDPEAVAGVAGAMRLALRDAGLAPHEIDCVSASARGDVAGDRREGRALREVFAERADDLAVTAIKDRVGEAFGASGAVQVVALVESMRAGIVPGVRGLGQVEDPFLLGKVSRISRARAVRTGLVNSVGFDGHSCSVVFTAC